MTDDSPTIAERYATAIADGSIRDVVLAAGMQPHSYGAALARLQVEYGNVRGALEKLGHIAPNGKLRADELRKAAKAEEGTAAQVLLREAESIPRRTAAEIVSARAFILIELKSLSSARSMTGAFATWIANREPKNAVDRAAIRSPKQVRPQRAMELAGHVLDVFLDAICAECDGTGRHGSRYLGQVETICKACGGTGQRRFTGKQIETDFCRDLHEEMRKELAAFVAATKRALLSSEAADANEALALLRDRLTELASAEAQTD